MNEKQIIQYTHLDELFEHFSAIRDERLLEECCGDPSTDVVERGNDLEEIGSEMRELRLTPRRVEEFWRFQFAER